MGESTQATGEAPLMAVQPSWWNFAKRLAILVVLLPILILLALYVLPGPLGYEIPVDVPVLAVGAVVGLLVVVPPVASYLQRIAVELRVFEDRLVLERGIVSKEIKELFVEDIRSIDTRQGLAQRIVGTGDLMIASSGTDDYEYVVKGIPDPRHVKQLIVEQREPPGRR